MTMYRAPGPVGVVTVDPHTLCTLEKYGHAASPEALYGAFRRLFPEWPLSGCVGKWVSRDSFSLLLPGVWPVVDDEASLRVAVEVEGAKAFVRLNNAFLPVASGLEAAEDAFYDRLLVVGGEAFVFPGGLHGLRSALDRDLSGSIAAQARALRDAIVEARRETEPETKREPKAEPIPEAERAQAAEEKAESARLRAEVQRLRGEAKAHRKAARRAEQRAVAAEKARAELDDQVAILQSSMRRMAETGSRGEAYYNAFRPLEGRVKDVGALSKGLGEVYRMLSSLSPGDPFAPLPDVEAALRRLQGSKAEGETFDSHVARLLYRSEGLHTLNRTLLERVSKEAAATKAACKRLGMEAVQRTMLQERAEATDREFDRGFFEMFTETLACSMEEAGETEVPKGKHLVYDARGLLKGRFPRFSGAWATMVPFEGQCPSSGEDDGLLFVEATMGNDCCLGLPAGATFADAEAALAEALGVPGVVFFHGFSGWPTVTFLVETYPPSMRVADATSEVRFVVVREE